MAKGARKLKSKNTQLHYTKAMLQAYRKTAPQLNIQMIIYS